MSNYITKTQAATRFRRSERTIENWLGEGYFAGYRDGTGQILVDADEIERAFKVNPRMRDGRRPYGPKARIVPLPIQSVAVTETTESGDAQ